MTAADREALWQRLAAAGLAHGDQPPAPVQATPWYVRAMLGIAGWIGALFFIGFLGTAMVVLFRNSTATLVVGVLCCAGAWLLFRAARENDFVSQFGLAASLAGQLLVVVGLLSLLGDQLSVGFYLAVAAFEAVLVAIVSNFTHRVWSTIAAVMAVSLAINEAGLAGLTGVAAGVAAGAFAWIWLHEARWVTDGRLWRPIGYGVAIALVALDGVALASEAFRPTAPATTLMTTALRWLGPALTGGVLVYTVHHLLERQRVGRSSRPGAVTLAAAGLVAVLGLGAPGVSAALLMVIVGFAGGLRTLMGIGAISLLGYLFWFYYSLHATLLVKSVVLTCTGLVLIGAWFGLRAWLEGDREQVHA